MAAREILQLLEAGPRAFAEWRRLHARVRPDLTKAELVGRSLLPEVNIVDCESGAYEEIVAAWDFSDCDLSDARIDGAVMRHVDLSRANLRGASLTRTRLLNCDLTDARIDHAFLAQAKFSECDLTRTRFLAADFRILVNQNGDDQRPRQSPTWESTARFDRVVCSETQFLGVDLSGVQGLESTVHREASFIDIHAISRSRGRLPLSFLIGCKAPLAFADSMVAWVHAEPVHPTCVLFFAGEDRDIARQVDNALMHRGIDCWLYTRDSKAGRSWRDDVEIQASKADAAVFLVSASALKSQHVLEELRMAAHRQARSGESVVFPVLLDSALFGWQHPLQPTLAAVGRVDLQMRPWEQALVEPQFDRLAKSIRETFARRNAAGGSTASPAPSS